MYPHERSLVEEMSGRPFALIGVNSDKDLEDIRRIVKEKELNWRSFQNKPEGAKKAISADWGVQGWPTIIVLDSEMRIRYRGHVGADATAIAKDLVKKLEAQN